MVKASDIDDVAFLRAVESARREGFANTNRFDVAEALGMPDKVVLAKARRLIKRKFIDGCDCGCRGDWELTDLGRERIGA